MTVDACAQGESVAHAARTGRWNTELAAHVANCASCRESRRVIRWMAEFAEAMNARASSLPDSHVIWLKARLLERWRRSDRALLPLRMAGVLSAVGLGAILALLPGDAWRSLQEWLTSAGILAWELPSVASPGPFAIAWLPVAILLVLLLLFTASEA